MDRSGTNYGNFRKITIPFHAAVILLFPVSGPNRKNQQGWLIRTSRWRLWTLLPRRRARPQGARACVKLPVFFLTISASPSKSALKKAEAKAAKERLKAERAAQLEAEKKAREESVRRVQPCHLAICLTVLN